MNTEEIIEGYMGSTEVNSIYQGSELIWPIFKYMIGGDFEKYKGTTQNRLIRLNNDGTKDTSFNIGTGFGDDVYTLNIDTINQKIYVGGAFRKYNDSTQNSLIRLNMDGTKDTSFNIGTGFSHVVYGSIIYAINIDTINSKIYVGGRFITYNGSAQKGLIRLNLDGTKDTSFNIGSGFGGDETVTAINIDTINQKIYVGGAFSTFNDGAQNNLVRLNMNGSKDTSFNIGTGFDMSVETINIDTINSKIYAGGDFQKYKGNTQNKLIRLNMDGTKDTSFDIGTGFDTNVAHSVSVINLDTINSKLYVGGAFRKYNDSTQNSLIRLNMDGTKDTSFDIGTGFNSSVNDLEIDTINQKIYAGGGFTTFQGSTQNRLIRLNMDGSKDNTFNIGTGFDKTVRTILKYI